VLCTPPISLSISSSQCLVRNIICGDSKYEVYSLIIFLSQFQIPSSENFFPVHFNLFTFVSASHRLGHRYILRIRNLGSVLQTRVLFLLFLRSRIPSKHIYRWMYSYMITVLWSEMAAHGGLALFQNENDLSPESDLKIAEKKIYRDYLVGSFCFILPTFPLILVF